MYVCVYAYVSACVCVCVRIHPIMPDNKEELKGKNILFVEHVLTFPG